MGKNDTVELDDPAIIDSTEATPGSEAEPTEMAEITFEAGDQEVTIVVGERFTAPGSGQIVGEIDRILQSENDTSKQINTREIIHWVYLDYGTGNHHDGDGTGGIPLGETAKQLAEGDMTLTTPATGGQQ